MKDKIINFFKNKFNIVLIIIQIVALVCYFLGNVSFVFSIMFFLLEGGFFITLGIRILIGVKNSRYSDELLTQLPYSQEEIQMKRKMNQNTNKNNKFVAFSFIVLGCILIFSLFSIFN
jgi:hypothetical protein